MPEPFPPDRRRPPIRLRLRREVRRAELALLAFGVVAAGFLALHLAERGNQVSLTARNAASSSTSPPAAGNARPEATTSPTSEVTRVSPAPAPRTAGSVAPPPASPPPRDAPSAVRPDTATTVPTPEVAPTTTTSTSTTSSTTTTTSTTTTVLSTP
jgi:hypothetical protein